MLKSRFNKIIKTSEDYPMLISQLNIDHDLPSVLCNLIDEYLLSSSAIKIIKKYSGLIGALEDYDGYPEKFWTLYIFYCSGKEIIIDEIPKKIEPNCTSKYSIHDTHVLCIFSKYYMILNCGLYKDELKVVLTKIFDIN
jgi:hypothetical protein